MTHDQLEAEIQRLLDTAAPLRLLHEDDGHKEPLGGIIDEINRLRALQANEPQRVLLAPERDPEAPVAAVEGADAQPLPHRRPGRPRTEPA